MDLTEAILTDDAVATRAALDQGANANAPDSIGKTPLLRALERLNLPVVTALLDGGGADPNLLAIVRPTYDDGELVQDAPPVALTPLMCLAQLGASRDGTVSADGGLAYTPTERAERERQGDPVGSVPRACRLADILLDRGADPNAAAPDGRTALMFAAQNGASTLAKHLLARGADSNARDAAGVTALMVAATVGTWDWNGGDNVACLEALLDADAEIDAVEQHGWSPLRIAIEYGTDAHVRLLVARGASTLPAAATDDPLAPILAVISGDMARLQQALAKYRRRRANRPCACGRTPLMWAASLGRADMAQTLLDAGAAVDRAEEETGWTALHHAVYQGHVDAARVLLKAGADPNLLAAEMRVAPPGASRYNALHWAVVRRRADIIPLLLEHGVSVEYDRGGPHMAYVAEANYLDLIERKRAAGESLELWEAVLSGNEDLVASLLDAGADIDEPYGGYLRSPLHMAAERGHGNLVRLLARRGARVDLPDMYGQTALIMAALYDQAEAVRALLEAGADPTLRDRSRRTALDYALDWMHHDIAQLLATAG